MASNQINCCNVNAFDFPCDLSTTANPAYNHQNPTDPYGSESVAETIFLVLSNLFLIFPAIYALIYRKDLLRFNLNILALIFSSFFHLCKRKNDNVGICIISFCMLRTFDYVFSTSVLLTNIFLLFEYIIVKYIFYNKSHNDVEYNNYTTYNINIQILIILSNALLIINLFNKTLLCSSIYSTYFFLITIGSSSLIYLVTSGLIYNITGSNQEITLKSSISTSTISTNICMNFQRNNHIDKNKISNIGIFLFGVLLVGMGILFFLSRDYIDSNYYWLFHSLWHILAALGQISFLKVLKL